MWPIPPPLPFSSCSLEKSELSEALWLEQRKVAAWEKNPGFPSSFHEPAQKLPRGNPSWLCISTSSSGNGGARWVFEPNDLHPSGPDSYATKFPRVCKYKDNDQLLQMTLTSSVLTLMLGGIQQGLRGMTWASTGVSWWKLGYEVNEPTWTTRSLWVICHFLFLF